MKNKVYIGMNGVGKSEILKNIWKDHKDNSIFIKYTEKENAPDSNVINKKNEVINQFKEFVDKLFSFSSSVKLKNLSKKDKNDFQNILNNTKKDSELENIWKEMISDPHLNFLKDKNVSKIIKSNKEESNIKEFNFSKKIYEFNFDNWKTSTNDGIKMYGTGKLVYFQIKFLYKYLNLIVGKKKDKYIIIDEPELFLHPSMKKQVGYMLRKISDKINVIVSTHSSIFLNSFYQPETTEIFSKKNHKQKWIKINFKNPYVFSSRKIYFEILMTSKIIITEGSNDTKLLEYIINSEDKINKNVYVLSAGCKSNIPNILDIVKGVKGIEEGNKKNASIFKDEDIFILYDNDNSKIQSSNNHKIWNNKIQNFNVKKYGFKEDLENYFNIDKKKSWDIYSFFNKQENKNKLKKFIFDSKLKNFIKYC